MKRIHLFEFEDFSWFPDSLRTCLTRLMVVMHRLLGSGKEIANLLQKALPYASKPAIVDLCSGSGGPLLAATKILAEEKQIPGLTLTLTDLYPNQKLAGQINQNNRSDISYITTPVDATDVPADLVGVRTMVSSFHHMKPTQARKILENAQESKQPICIYEISDNSFPISLWWVALPFNFIMAFFITPFVRPLTGTQIFFTYIIPVIPFFFAWDGAVSNARTYTLNDMDILLRGMKTRNYIWEKGLIPGKAKKLFLLGLPVKN